MLSAVLRHSGCVGFQLLGSGWEGLLWGAAGALGRGCPACPLPPAAEVFLLVVSRRQRPKAAAVGCSGQGLQSSILLWFPEGCRAPSWGSQVEQDSARQPPIRRSSWPTSVGHAPFSWTAGALWGHCHCPQRIRHRL